MKIVMACDPNAAAFKQEMMEFVRELGHEVTDFGSDDPIYANVAIRAAEPQKRKASAESRCLSFLVRLKGLEPTRIAAREPKGDVTLVIDPYSVVIVPFSNSSRSLNISRSLWILGKIFLSNCALIDLTDALSPAASTRLPAFNMTFAPPVLAI